MGQKHCKYIHFATPGGTLFVFISIMEVYSYWKYIWISRAKPVWTAGCLVIVINKPSKNLVLFFNQKATTNAYYKQVDVLNDQLSEDSLS